MCYSFYVLIFDDFVCKVLFDWDIEMVLMVFWCDGEGKVGDLVIGFVCDEW